jgi:hypothetical protein
VGGGAHSSGRSDVEPGVEGRLADEVHEIDGGPGRRHRSTSAMTRTESMPSSRRFAESSSSVTGTPSTSATSSRIRFRLSAVFGAELTGFPPVRRSELDSLSVFGDMG